MKIAIHNRPGSYSDQWIVYCDTNNIPYKLVDCYDSNIIEQISDCDGLMWHWAQWDVKAILFARQLIYSVEKTGNKVFPNSHTCWHFDDKVGQKYLLEAIGAPFVSSYVFYDKKTALQWVEKANFPKVFKLRGGAGALNVRLIKNRAGAKKIVKKAFRRGFLRAHYGIYLKERLWYLKRDKNMSATFDLIKGIARLFIQTKLERMSGREKGYVYFQDFLPGNKYDTRVIVIGNRAFAILRKIRDNDFRASGSGLITYDPKKIRMDYVSVAFKIAENLNTQSIAFDFIEDQSGKPRLLEISYGFNSSSYLPCPGYWTSDLKWHEKKIIPEDFMIEDFLSELKQSKKL